MPLPSWSRLYSRLYATHVGSGELVRVCMDQGSVNAQPFTHVIVETQSYSLPDRSKMEPPLSSGDVPGVLALLNGALSMAPAQQKQAESTLAALEQRQGFCSCLVVRKQHPMTRQGSALRGHTMTISTRRRSSHRARYVNTARDGWPPRSSRTQSATGEGGQAKGGRESAAVLHACHSCTTAWGRRHPSPVVRAIVSMATAT